jgi:putative ABC transport system permease protein
MTLLDEPVDLDWETTRLPITTPISLRARGGRWRIGARLARREMRRRPWRTVLAVILIALPVAGLVCADVEYRSGTLGADASLEWGAADARVISEGRLLDRRSEIEAQLPPETRSTWSVLLPQVPLRNAATPDQLVQTTILIRDLTDPLTEGMVRGLDGRLPGPVGEVLLDPDVAEAFGVGLGDELTLVRPAQTFTVVGIADVGVPWGGPGAFLAPGFDLSVIRPEAVLTEILVQGPAIAGRPGFVTVESYGPPPLVETPGEVTPALYFEYPYGGAEAEAETLLVGWLFGVLLMGVLGIVVAAAFAVSGRRQLVTIGQLSATGADPKVLRRFLALQGTWTGVAGALVGLAGGLAVVHGFRTTFGVELGDEGRLAFHAGDLTVIALTAVVVATVAAIVPTRSLAGMSVLSALGGRRPLPRVRRRQLPISLALLGAGLVIVTTALDSSYGSVGTAATDLVPALLGTIALLAGVCGVCPAVIVGVARLGARRPGVAMLATRSLGRHRARAAAILAAIVAVAGTATAFASAVEMEVREEQRQTREQSWQPDGVALRAYRFEPDVERTTIVDPESIDPRLREKIEAIVGPVTWVAAPTIATGRDGVGEALVADDALFSLMGMTPEERAQVAAFDVVWLQPDDGGLTVSPEMTDDLAGFLGRGARIAITGLRFGYWTNLVSPAHAAELGLEVGPPALFGRAAHDLTADEVEQIRLLWIDNGEQHRFAEFPLVVDQIVIDARCCPGGGEWTTWARLAAIGGALLLTGLIVGLGMALWAAEGRDERATLVAVGASPRTLAALAASKAWILAVVGTLLAVPLGYGTLYAVNRAVDNVTVFPWLFAAAAVVALPLVIAAVTWLGSTLGQRARPVRSSRASLD